MTDERAGGLHAYPLMENAADDLRAASGRPLSAVGAGASDLVMADLQISAEALRAQAAIAARAGYTQLAGNLARAAELTRVPNDDVLRMYGQLRPGRATYAELLELAEQLERDFEAPLCARLVREAAGVYQARRLLTDSAA